MGSKRITPYNQAISVGEHVRFLLADRGSSFPGCPKWPADVFAVAASLLAHAGAYASILTAWPPAGEKKTWTGKARRIARQWRRDWQKIPSEIVLGWKVLGNEGSLAVHDICHN